MGGVVVLELFGEALGGHGVPGVGFTPELVELPLLGLLLPGVVELEVDPGVELEELLLVPGNCPQGPLLGCVPFGVVVLFGVVLGVVLGVALGVEAGVVLCGVFCGVAVPGAAVDPGVVAAPGVGVDPGVVDPGVVLCPAVPVELLELPGVVPPAGAVCATAQLPQQSNVESKISLFLDICIIASGLLVASF